MHLYAHRCLRKGAMVETEERGSAVPYEFHSVDIDASY